MAFWLARSERPARAPPRPPIAEPSPWTARPMPAPIASAEISELRRRPALRACSVAWATGRRGMLGEPQSVANAADHTGRETDRALHARRLRLHLVAGGFVLEVGGLDLPAVNDVAL